MEQRQLGNTGLKLSVLGFGCGMVGGLMIKGSAAEQARAVARALELGINYFDTAPHYGDGASECNLGPALKAAGAGKETIILQPRFERPVHLLPASSRHPRANP